MYFSNLKEKRQKAYRIESYDEVFTNTLISMFTYRGDSVPEEILEYQSFIDIYSMLDGACAIWKLTLFWPCCITYGIFIPTRD